MTKIKKMNSISWFVGHLAFHEHLYWCKWAQGEDIFPELAQYGWGQPATTPPYGLDEILDARWMGASPSTLGFLPRYHHTKYARTAD